MIGPAAARGEHDSALLDRVNSLALRWAAAEAYAHLGRTDSAVAMMELVVQPTRMPGNAFALRGITYSFAQRRLGSWYGALGRREEARGRYRTFLQTVTSPDSELALMLEEVRRALDELQRGG